MAKSPESSLAASRIMETSSSIFLVWSLMIAIRRIFSSSVRVAVEVSISVLAFMEVRGLRSSWTMIWVKSSFILARDFSRVMSWMRNEAPMTFG